MRKGTPDEAGFGAIGRQEATTPSPRACLKNA